MVFWPMLRFAARRDGVDGLAEGAGIIVRRRGQFLAERQEQRAVERARGAADGHHQLGADGLERVGQRLVGDRVAIGAHRVEAALHVGAVVAVADGGIERGQLLGMGGDGAGGGVDGRAELR